MEIWKPINGFENTYAISNIGQVKNISSRPQNGNKLLKLRTRKNGYKNIELYKNGRKYGKMVHSLVGEHFIEKPFSKEKLLINHKNLNPSDNRVENLEWVTRGENQSHWRLMRERKLKAWRIGSLKYIQKTKQFSSMKEFINFLESGELLKFEE